MGKPQVAMLRNVEPGNEVELTLAQLLDDPKAGDKTVVGKVVTPGEETVEVKVPSGKKVIPGNMLVELV
jgi:hypothetical protein